MLPLNRTIERFSVNEVYQQLVTRPSGLTQEEAIERLTLYGANHIADAPVQPLWRKMWANLTHLMALLLWFGGFVAFLAQLPELGIAIWLVNLINGAFSFWQEHKAEQATVALRKLLPAHARVLRDGMESQILAETLVPGDLLLLAEGDHISADARLVRAAELYVDQSTLTGESRPVHKIAEDVAANGLARAELPNLVFAGTNVAAGTGTAVVYGTGVASEFGKIALLTQKLGDELSPLQKEIQVVTKIISLIAVSMGMLFFVLAIGLGDMRLAEGFIFGLGMIVAFVPEGLLPTVTLALAMGVQRMVKRHALIKRLSAVETLGSTSVICTDKTGTLTQNEMTVRNLWVAGRTLRVSGVGYTPVGEICDTNDQCITLDNADLRALLLTAGLCNDARLLPPNHDTARWTILGDPTEAALAVVAAKGGLDLATDVQQLPRLRELPFDAQRKRMTTIHQLGTSQLALVKGAPKEILALCTHRQQAGVRQLLTSDNCAEILAANDAFAREGLRVLAMAQRTLPPDFHDFTAPAVEQELTFLGLAAMADPPRPEVAAAVVACQRAGIRIIMITGDYGLTAESIARRIGIVHDPSVRIVTGGELEVLDEAELRAILAGEVIFARVAPEHKLRVVSALQSMGLVVAVTGDGVNDAPALKKADIGVAMGVAGTDVAKEAADMILTDDNFASIVGAIEEGRAVYDNIKKFTSYIFTSNTPEAVPFIFFAFSGGRIPLALTIMQILAVDLGTDLVPALALGAEPPAAGVMNRPPRQRGEHLITTAMLTRSYLWLGPIQSFAAMAAFYFLYWRNGFWGQWLDLPASGLFYYAATTMALGAIVTTQIGNLFAQRATNSTLRQIGLFTNRLVWIGIGTELILFVLIAYVPILQAIFGTAAIGWREWLFLLAWTPVLYWVDRVRDALLHRCSSDACIQQPLAEHGLYSALNENRSFWRGRNSGSHHNRSIVTAVKERR